LNYLNSSPSFLLHRNVSQLFGRSICFQRRFAIHCHDVSSRRNSLDFCSILRKLLCPSRHRRIRLVIHDIGQPYLLRGIVRHGENIRDVFHDDNGRCYGLYRICHFSLPHDWISSRPKTDCSCRCLTDFAYAYAPQLLTN